MLRRAYTLKLELEQSILIFKAHLYFLSLRKEWANYHTVQSIFVHIVAAYALIL